jgi:23S rRNA pseudouridine2605 synthase
MRIAKFISASGHCSRRAAERLIEEGKVKVNGKLIDTPATLVSESDEIEVEGKKLSRIENPRLWLFNKPPGCICTRHDEQNRQTIYDILPPEFKNVHYIGRLDMSSEGLLLLTDSPEVKNYYEHPKNRIPRVYLVRVFGIAPKKMFDFAKKGIVIRDEETGKNMVYHANIEPYKAPEAGSKNAWLKFTLKEGKNREIRRICEHFGLQVSKLKRISFGDFHLGSLDKGKFTEV